MSRHPSRHNGVSCDACGKSGFGGKRYKCLTCYDFDLCQDCFEAEETGQAQHSTDHPMQVILTKVEADLFYFGENYSIDQPQSFTCPLCGELGFSENELKDHVTRLHTDSASIQEVVCPVCAAYPTGNPNHQTTDFSGHLMLDHSRSLRDADLDQGSVHSRVRRMMVRSRGGRERHYGLLRESQLSQDNTIDPLSELLSHLGGGPGRRLPSDIPPHIQQLLDHQERQGGLERGSPSRRPVYRKLLIGRGGTRDVPSAGGHTLFSPREVLEMSRSSKDSHKLDFSASSQNSKTNSAYLLNNYRDAKLTGQEEDTIEQERRDKSLFVQDLLLSSLAFSDSSSDSNEET